LYIERRWRSVFNMYMIIFEKATSASENFQIKFIYVYKALVYFYLLLLM
jgi:hypothetical protein